MSDATHRALALARHFSQIEQPEKVLQTLEGADDAALEDVEYWALRGAALFDLDRFDDAARVLTKGLEIDPEDIQLLYLLARTESARGDLADGERHILEALRLAPENAELLLAYAILVARAGQFAKARALMDKAAQIEPQAEGLPACRFILATLEGKDKPAQRHSEQWVAENPEDPHAIAVSGIAMGDQGKAVRGYRRLRSAASLDPRVVEGMEDVFEERRLWSHWSLKPLWPILRFGAGKVWFAAIAIMLALNLAGLRRAAALFALAYLVLVIYSWVAPPIVRRLLKRRYG